MLNVVCLMLMGMEFIGMNRKGKRKEERIRRKMLLFKSVSNFLLWNTKEHSPHTDLSLVITAK